jgi:putative transposase
LHDRDVNAAINLKNMAVSSTVSACGGEGSGLAAMRGEPGSGEAGIQPQS